jgi:hypothetical protein
MIQYNMGAAEQNQKHYQEAEKLYLEGVKTSESTGMTYNTKIGY